MPLRRAEAVLFVYYDQRQIFKIHSFLYQSVCADEYGNFSVSHPLEKLIS